MQPLRQGETGAVVAEVQVKLHALGLLPSPDAASIEDAVFDSATERAVRAFQQQRGLRVDGIVGPETYRALDEARWRLGDRVLLYHVSAPYIGDDVAALQARLLELGFDPGRVDGIFGRRTDAALRDFQRNTGLTPDGTFGPSSMRAIEQLRRSVVGGDAWPLREHEALHRSGRTLAGKVVVVDPGHGQDDPGHVAHGFTEAELTFDVASRLEGRLQAAGALAFPTRAAEGNPADAARAAFANAAEADLLISLHVDGAPSPACHGVATYYFGSGPGRRSALGERLAALVQREIVARTDLLDCRTHAKTWELLRETRMPAVQVEVGYLTNASDAARLGDSAFRDAVAEAILVAVQRLYLPAGEDPGTGQLDVAALQRA